MTATGQPHASLERLFLEQLPVIDRILGIIAQRHALTATDADEFGAWARARLTENGYAILGKFEGRASMPTYLSAVLTNLFRDFRNSIWGRWRPSAAAQRMGPIGIRMEELLSRDACPLREAIATLQGAGATETDATLSRMAAALPHRPPHRDVSLDEVAELLPDSTDNRGIADDAQALVLAALHAAIDALPTDDRVITRMRFWDGLSVADVARYLHLDQKPLYRRLDAIHRRLREQLAERGVTADIARELLSEEGT